MVICNESYRKEEKCFNGIAKKDPLLNFYPKGNFNELFEL